MKLINKEKKENNFIEFIVNSDAEQFEKAIESAYKKSKKQISIPGFRKGKAPLAVIEGMYGPEVFYQDALDELIQSAFEQGIEEGEIEFIGSPAVLSAEVTPDRCATYTFTVELYPEVELGEYKGIEVTLVPTDVTDEEIDAEVKAEAAKNARIITVDDRPAQMGDTANINFDGFLDKEKTTRFDGGKADGYDLELGSNSFVPGFEESIVGMNIGDEKDILITFPEDYVEDLAGKEVVFAVKLNELTAKELPEIDDEFAKDVSEFDTLAEYKEDIKNNLLKRKEDQAKLTQRNEALLKAADNMKCEVPETMIRSHIEAIIRNFASNYGFSDPNVDIQTLASMLGIDEQTMNTAIRPSAINEAKMELLTKAVIAKEKIEATEEQLEEYCQKISETVNATVEDIKNYFGMDYIVSEYKKEAAMNLVADSAKAVAEKKAKKTAKKTADKEEKEVKEKKPAAKKTAAPKDENKDGEEKKPAAKKAPAKKKEEDK